MRFRRWNSAVVGALAVTFTLVCVPEVLAAAPPVEYPVAAALALACAPAHGPACVQRLVWTVHGVLDSVHPSTLMFEPIASGEGPGAGAAPGTVSILVNGRRVVSDVLVEVQVAVHPRPRYGAPHAPLALPLRSGANTVEVVVSVGSMPGSSLVSGPSRTPLLQVAELVVEGSRPLAWTSGPGAPLPFVQLEAEAGMFTGLLLGPNFTFGTLPSEASGRQAVVLEQPGQFVQFTLPSDTNGVSIRASVPDVVPDGGFTTPLELLVDDVLVMNVTLSNHYSWLYGSYPFTKNPGDGGAHHFFDDVDVVLPSVVTAGSVLALRRPLPDAALDTPVCAPAPPPSTRTDCGFNGITQAQCEGKGCCWLPVSPNPTSVPWCYTPPAAPPSPGTVPITIDLVDVYNIAPPTAQPPGSLSVVDAGADPSGAVDSSAAFETALAKGRGGAAVVWVPPGTYLITQLLLVDDVTVVGAGCWHSVLQGPGAGLVGSRAPQPSTNVQIHDLAIIGDVRIRNDSSPLNGVGGAFSNSVLANLRIAHEKCGMWLDGPFSSLLITGVQIRNTMADGVNFHGGVQGCRVEYSSLRNTGDDGLAMWSSQQVGVPNANNTFQFNTVQLPILANNIAIYGGEDNSILGNALFDTVIDGGGMHVGNRFTSTPTSGTVTIANNLAVRTGSVSPGYPTPIAALWFFALDESLQGATIVATNNTLVDSPQAAVGFVAAPGKVVQGVVLTNSTVTNVGTFVLDVAAPGWASVIGLVASGIGGPGAVNNCTQSFELEVGPGNVGWVGSQCCVPQG